MVLIKRKGPENSGPFHEINSVGWSVEFDRDFRDRGVDQVVTFLAFNHVRQYAPGRVDGDVSCQCTYVRDGPCFCGSNHVESLLFAAPKRGFCLFLTGTL